MYRNAGRARRRTAQALSNDVWVSLESDRLLKVAGKGEALKAVRRELSRLS